MASKNSVYQLTSVSKFDLVEKDVPKTPDDGVVVKVSYCGICHSDVHVSERVTDPRCAFPRVLGHEISGSVFAIGENAAKLKPDLHSGDKVIVFPWGNCAKCAVCKNDLSYCEDVVLSTDVDASKLHTYGFYQEGGFQNYLVINELSVIIKIPEGIPMDQASLVPCSGITSFSAAGKIRASVDTALKLYGKALVGVVGAGGLGLWAIQIIKAIYPPEVKVIAIDVVKEKLDDANEHGADFTHQWGTKETAEEARRDFIKANGRYLDGAMDFTGLTSVLSRVFYILNVGATLSLVGLGNKLELPLNPVLFKSVTICGNNTGTRDNCQAVLDLMLNGKVKPPPITLVSLDQVAENILKMKEGKQRGRAVVKM